MCHLPNATRPSLACKRDASVTVCVMRSRAAVMLCDRSVTSLRAQTRHLVHGPNRLRLAPIRPMFVQFVFFLCCCWTTIWIAPNTVCHISLFMPVAPPYIEANLVSRQPNCWKIEWPTMHDGQGSSLACLIHLRSVARWLSFTSTVVSVCARARQPEKYLLFTLEKEENKKRKR